MSSTESVAPGLHLEGDFRSDVWGWEARVTGKLVGGLACADVAINVNDQLVATTRTEAGFTAVIPIVTGENTVRATCLGPVGVEGKIPSRVVHFTGRLERRPRAQMTLALDGRRLTLSGLESRDAHDGRAIRSYRWSARAGNPAPVLAAEGDAEPAEFPAALASERVTLSLPSVDGEYYFDLTVTDAAGLTDHTANYVVVENGQARIPDYDRENPAFVEQTVVYGIVPFLYGRPSWPGLTARLPDLAELGINAIWLAPINQSPPGDYGYAVLEYQALRTSYGSVESFRQMVQTAHQHGLRVLMDFVPNHSSDQHEYYQNALREGRASRFYDFYDRDENGTPTHYFHWTYLPNLNFDNPEVERWMIESFAYWVREFDIDGFRVDAAWGIRQRNPAFWMKWRRELKRIKPDLLLLAEAGARDSFYFDHGFDAAYDWTDQLGKWAWEFVWTSDHHRELAAKLEAALLNPPAGYHPDALILRFLNNNDTGERFITRYGAGLARAATALLLTLPGLPCLYDGDELGAEYKPYGAPPPLTWEERVPGLRDYHQRLIRLRRGTPSLHSRHWQLLAMAPGPQVTFGYLRWAGPGDPPVVVVINFSGEPAEAGFKLPAEFEALGQGAAFFDLLSEQTVPVTGGEFMRINVPACGARLLTRPPRS
jgi:cyclomaltodextrinase / maltogenic alpha-amylase / neopullulanase